MSKILIILNDPPYGTERSYQGLRLAKALLKPDPAPELTVFLMADSVACAKRGQKVPSGYYNLELMLKAVARKGTIVLCGTCMDARGLTEDELADGARRGTLDELAALTDAGSAFLRWEEGATTVSQDLTLGFAVAGDRNLAAVFDTCQADVTLSPQVVSSPAVFHACESITAGSGFEIASEVIFRAGQAIALGDGFTVAAGASFRAEIKRGPVEGRASLIRCCRHSGVRIRLIPGKV